ncbi:MAG: AraC family transcriptional regulator [Prevotella sp.]|nr:AraC family transcriptional regulator [Prevotella sp.]
MSKETRQVLFDADLQLEACFFKGISQPFPPHFHEYCVVGFIENGRRRIFVRGREFTAEAGDILLFAPGENHSCRSTDGTTLNYGSLNIMPEAAETLVPRFAGTQSPFGFSENIVRDGELFSSLKKLHETVMQPEMHADASEKKRLFKLTFSQLAEYAECRSNAVRAFGECRGEVEKACLYMRENFSEHISLDSLCRLTALSRAALIRAFAKEKGISPYRYLENIRLEAAKNFLRQGDPPAEAALKAGFSDQSHFTNFFRAYIGLTPKQYGGIFKPQR